jgi:hypothetical protein
MNLDEARTLANVNERAQRLYEDGYRIRTLDTDRCLIRKRYGATYTLDRAEQSCTCPFFTKHGGRYSCKHVLGWRKLQVSQWSHISRLSARWEAVEQAATIEQVLMTASRVLCQRLEIPIRLEVPLCLF